jgi:hypothetical protein
LVTVDSQKAFDVVDHIIMLDTWKYSKSSSLDSSEKFIYWTCFKS